jgi:hypothetical protein
LDEGNLKLRRNILARNENLRVQRTDITVLRMMSSLREMNVDECF